MEWILTSDILPAPLSNVGFGGKRGTKTLFPNLYEMVKVVLCRIKRKIIYLFEREHGIRRDGGRGRE